MKDLSHNKRPLVMGGQGRTTKDVRHATDTMFIVILTAIWTFGVICGLMIGAML